MEYTIVTYKALQMIRYPRASSGVGLHSFPVLVPWVRHYHLYRSCCTSEKHLQPLLLAVWNIDEVAGREAALH